MTTASPPLLAIEGLSRTFGALAAVRDLSLTVHDGEILGIIGPNGAGKTTTVNLMAGAIRPTSGRVTFDGRDVTGLKPHALARRGLVRTFQATTVFGTQTVRENCLRGAFLHLWPGFFATLFSTRAAHAMRQAVEREVDRLLDWLGMEAIAETEARTLPYGMQKTLGMAIALAARPRLILLDEPVAGMSALETDHVLGTIRRIRDVGVSAIVIDHNMRFISGLCDRVLVLHHGQVLASGKPAEVMRDPAVVEAYLGTSLAAQAK
jgi:branched-chain amino acid transport system ATP-binding protein